MFSNPKVLAARPNLHNDIQTSFWPEDNKQKDVDQVQICLNSLTPKSVPAGTKNSRSEGFLLVKHKHTNIPTMMEPFAPQRRGIYEYS
jgi:hypothetical protein